MSAQNPFTRPDPDDGIDSPVAMQLRRGFPWLRFDEPLESEFHRTHRAQSIAQIRINLWLALMLVLAFTLMSRLVLEHDPDPLLDVIRFGIIMPLVLAALVLTHRTLYARFFPAAIQVLAPTAGVAIVVLELLAREQGGSMFSSLVLTIIFLYFLIGLGLYAALRSAGVMLIAYITGAVLVDLPASEAINNSLVLLFTNVIGATVCYALEKANRTGFLESRLLAEMASRDGLTGIYNRRMLEEHLDTVWQQAMRDRTPLALLLVDIDHFKGFNDHYGHQAGDDCLKRVAHALARTARRPLDFTSRYGGEEFAIVLYDARRGYVEEHAEQIRTAVRALGIRHPDSLLTGVLTVSIGAACVVPGKGRSRFGFVQLADEALYEAKARGRNHVVIMDREYEALTTGSFRRAARAIG